MGDGDYKFLPIVDAITCVNQRVNLIGVAVEISLPKTTRGTDCFCSVRIVDESRPSGGIQINFFAETMEKLPSIECAGNVVLVSDVVIKTWNPPDVYALFNKRISTFALFEGSGSSIKPYQNSPRYLPRYLDNMNIMRLRKWCCEKIEGLIGLQESLSLREIKEVEHIDLFCKIVHVAQVRDDEWMLFIWDGTDTPPASVEAKLEDELENELPLALEPSPLSRDILCTFPTVGTVLRVFVDQGHEKLGIKFLKTNRWVKLINLRCEAHAAMWRAVLTPSSKLCYLPDDNDTVMERQRYYEERFPSKWGRMPLTCFPGPSNITETDHPDVPLVTLMDILTYPEVMYKYKCVVRVVALLPWRPEVFRSPRGFYRVRLTLEDATARIHAYLYKEDGVKFFGNGHSVDVLTKKRNKLLGVAGEDQALAVENGTRNPPWIQCCLKSYYIDKSDVWGSRNYRVCDTRCLG